MSVASIAWTILIAVALWAASEVVTLRLTSGAHLARALYTAALVLAILHSALAFHVVHEWRHEAAVLHTARQTAEMTGWNWGGGLFFNYIFLAIWTADAAWWWLKEQTRSTRPACGAAC